MKNINKEKRGGVLLQEWRFSPAHRREALQTHTSCGFVPRRLMFHTTGAPAQPKKTPHADTCQHGRSGEDDAMSENPTREANGRFLPGFTANPSGRPRVVEEIKQLARQHAPAAFQRICELVDSKDERIALAASQAILDRAYGRPMQAIQSEVTKLDIGQLFLAAAKAASEGGDGAKVIDGVAVEQAEIEW
jgi:hypothetical protein